MDDDTKTFFLTVVLGCLEAVWQEEIKINKHSARASRLSRGIDQTLSLIDIYCPYTWPPDKIKIACKLFDEIDHKIRIKLKPFTPLQRASNGQFMKRCST